MNSNGDTMGYVKSIAEVIEEAGKQKSKADKVKVLKENDSRALRNILILTYDKTKEFYVPNEAPPYKPSEQVESQGLLQQESVQRRLKYIVKGFSSPDIHQIKRETIFIELLETVDKKDAEVLCQMIEKKPFTGLTLKTIQEAFPGLINDG